MEKDKHKVTFWMPKSIWKEFSKKCIDEGKTRTEMFVELAKKYIDKR